MIRRPELKGAVRGAAEESHCLPIELIGNWNVKPMQVGVPGFVELGEIKIKSKIKIKRSTLAGWS